MGTQPLGRDGSLVSLCCNIPCQAIHTPAAAPHLRVLAHGGQRLNQRGVGGGVGRAARGALHLAKHLRRARNMSRGWEELSTCPEDPAAQRHSLATPAALCTCSARDAANGAWCGWMVGAPLARADSTALKVAAQEGGGWISGWISGGRGSSGDAGGRLQPALDLRARACLAEQAAPTPPPCLHRAPVLGLTPSGCAASTWVSASSASAQAPRAARLASSTL